jgi:hypothetical protein
MLYPWESPQLGVEQEITAAYEDSFFSNFPPYESFMESLSNEQFFELDFIANSGSTAWCEHLAPSQPTSQEEQCVFEAVVEGRNVSTETLGENQDLKRAISEIGQRIDKVEETVGNF